MVKKRQFRNFIIASFSLVALIVLVVFYVPIQIVDEDRGGRIQEVPKTLYDLISEGRTDIEIPNDDTIIFCAEIYEPVCGVDGKTYSNDCFAEQAGVEIMHAGECLPMEEQKNFFEELYNGN